MSYRACNGLVIAGTVNVTPATAVGFITGYSVDEESEQIDVSVMGACTEASLAGPVRVSITLDGFSRHLPGTVPAVDTGQALVIPGSQISLGIQPNGAGTGKPQLIWLDVTVLSRRFAGEVKGVPTWSVTCSGNVATNETAQT